MKCANCGKPATELHHKFSQTKFFKKLYGELIHDRRNLQPLCYDCHHNKPLDKLSEIEFCEMMGIVPRSITGKLRYDRINKPYKD